MLVRAHLSMCFYSLALAYTCKLLRVLPAKGLKYIKDKPTTTYTILHGKKPRISHYYKVFGCPVVFKRYKPMIDGKIITEFKHLHKRVAEVFLLDSLMTKLVG